MPKQLTLQQIQTTETLSGPNVSLGRQAKRILDANNLGSNFFEDGSMNNCYEFLTIIGITVEAISQKDLSLKKISLDKEFIKNPNILEKKDYEQINNEYDKPDDKFPNEDDPFYQLDDYRDENESKIKNVNNVNKNDLLIDIADGIVKTNLSPNSCVKQFRSLS